jgi:hypothetical protein
LGCFGGGAYISNNFLGLNIRFRAKTRDLENGFLDLGIQKWDFLHYDTPAELMVTWGSTMVDEEGGGGGDTCKQGGVDKMREKSHLGGGKSPIWGNSGVKMRLHWPGERPLERGAEQQWARHPRTSLMNRRLQQLSEDRLCSPGWR